MSKIEKFKKNKHFVFFSKDSINENEEILDVLEGFIGKLMGKGEESQYNGLLLCTNQKISFHSKGFFNNVSRSIPIKKVSSIDVDKGMMFHNIVIHTSNDKISFECGDKFEDIKKFKLLIERIRDQNDESYQNSTGDFSTKVLDDPYEKLKKLKELKDQGIINNQDYEEKKKKFLDSI